MMLRVLSLQRDGKPSKPINQQHKNMLKVQNACK